VQNILALRFANTIWEALWNNRHIDHVQIVVAEKVGVGRRGGYYETSGHCATWWPTTCCNC
jgi:glucose-6-phosphate 1-dehydrogenase